jgi:hypothetical protein
MDLPSFEFGTVYSKFKGFQISNSNIELPIVKSLAGLAFLAAKCVYYWTQQVKGQCFNNKCCSSAV